MRSISVLFFLAAMGVIFARADEIDPLSTDDPQAVALFQACEKGDLDEVKKLGRLGRTA